MARVSGKYSAFRPWLNQTKRQKNSRLWRFRRIPSDKKGFSFLLWRIHCKRAFNAQTLTLDPPCPRHSYEGIQWNVKVNSIDFNLLTPSCHNGKPRIPCTRKMVPRLPKHPEHNQLTASVRFIGPPTHNPGRHRRQPNYRPFLRRRLPPGSGLIAVRPRASQA